MEEYDVVIVGGRIAGSVAARDAAKRGFKTLLVEKFKTPRSKPCSGIQFEYFEKLIGEKIPREKLCVNELFKVEIVTPSDKVLKGRMKMLNFWRLTLDSWLNSLAADVGADSHDNTSLLDFVESRSEDRIIVKLSLERGREKLRPAILLELTGCFQKLGGGCAHKILIGKLQEQR